MRNSKLANQIRNLAFSCKSKDVFSCEFGNEFADGVDSLIQHAKGSSVKVGDIISWEYQELEYFAEVVVVTGDGFGVYVVYDGIGLQQDYIEPKNVLRVWKQ